MICMGLSSCLVVSPCAVAHPCSSRRKPRARDGLAASRHFSGEVLVPRSRPLLMLPPTRRLNKQLLCRAMSVDTVVDGMQQLYASALAALPAPAADLVKATVEENVNIMGVILAFMVTFLGFMISSRALGGKKKNLPPTIPGGFPLVGNMLQLTERKPHKTFTKWAQEFGPIFHLKMGGINTIVISSADLAKEIMVTKFDSVSTRRVTTAMKVMTGNKTMVATSDYGEEHRMLKKIVVGNLLGMTAQRANRIIREDALNTMIDEMFRDLKGKNGAVLDIRKCIQYALFPFSMRQVFGYAPEKVYVDGFGELDKWDIFQVLVIDPLKVVIEVDWRNYFPALSWIPNSDLEKRLNVAQEKKLAVVSALIEEQRKILQTREPTRCFADIVLTEYEDLSPLQLKHTIWEPIIESADTTLVTSEWALYEIAKDPKIQERLYTEIKTVVGDRMVSEDDFPNLPYLEAIVKETLRYYAPVSILPPRYVHEDITIGGYDVPKGSDVLINIYGINWDPQVWSNPEVFNPDRCLGDKTLDLGIKDFRILPFGGGKRMCAGITQAFNIIPMNIAAVVQHFELSLLPVDIKNAEDTVYLTSHKLHPLQAHLKPRVRGRLPGREGSVLSALDEASARGCPAHTSPVDDTPVQVCPAKA